MPSFVMLISSPLTEAKRTPSAVRRMSFATRSASFFSVENVIVRQDAPSRMKSAHASSRLKQPMEHILNSFLFAAAYSSIVPWKSR